MRVALILLLLTRAALLKCVSNPGVGALQFTAAGDALITTLPASIFDMTLELSKYKLGLRSLIIGLPRLPISAPKCSYSVGSSTGNPNPLEAWAAGSFGDVFHT